MSEEQLAITKQELRTVLVDFRSRDQAPPPSSHAPAPLSYSLQPKLPRHLKVANKRVARGRECDLEDHPEHLGCATVNF